jgi:hypothetical protein
MTVMPSTVPVWVKRRFTPLNPDSARFSTASGSPISEAMATAASEFCTLWSPCMASLRSLISRLSPVLRLEIVTS